MLKVKILYLDVIPQHLAMSLGSTLAQALASFASSSHDGRAVLAVVNRMIDMDSIDSPIF